MRTADLIPDGALTRPVDDRLEHDAVAAVVADLASQVRTSANIALFGPWGSGKSSLISLIEHRLALPEHRAIATVRYDAWKFGGAGLHRNFLAEVARQLKLSDREKSFIDGGVETTRLRLGSYLYRNWRSILGASLISAVAGFTWALVRAGASVDWKSWDESWGHVQHFVPAGGATFGLVLAGLVLSNQSLSSAVEKRTVSPLQEADQFFAAFDKTMRRLTRRRWLWRAKQISRLVVFVDELDRCSPDKVVGSLVQIMTYLGHDKCVFIVAADRDVLEEALKDAPQAKVARANEPYYATSGAFLDKVFQHQVELPPTRPEALTAYALALAEDAAGLWQDLREAGRREYEDVIYALVPSHVRSPRRVKVLMNDFATSARVMERRGIPWREKAVQIAILTVLQTEFPSVVRDFLMQPRLLDALVDDAGPLSDELTELVRRYQPDSDGTTPAPLLSSEDNAETLRAQHRLSDQLHAYLWRIKAAGAPMPTPALVYVQNAAHADGLVDERLSRILDDAADLAPAYVIQEFRTASDADRQAAIRFLVAQLGNKFGPLRANLVEVVSRLAFELDAASARAVTNVAAPVILGEVAQGRWRPDSTLGALWLGLLNPSGGDSVDALAAVGEIDRLVATGDLEPLIARMEHLGSAADRLFGIIGGAYAEHPEYLILALNASPPDTATRLFTSQRAAVNAWFSSPNAPAANATLVAIAAQNAVQDRFEVLVEAITSRQSTELSPAAAELIEMGIKFAVPTRNVLIERARQIAAVLTPVARNRAALRLILTAAPPAEAQVWVPWLSPSAGGPREASADVARKCASVFCTPLGPEDRAAVWTALVTSLDWAGVQAVWADVAEIAHDALVTSIPDGTAPRRAMRQELMRLASHLDSLTPGSDFARTALRDSLIHAVSVGAVSEEACSHLLLDVSELSPPLAETVASTLAAANSASNHPASILRLRMRAREVAALPSVPAADVASVLPATHVTREWVSTRPPVQEFLQLMKRIAVAPPSLAAYASQRSAKDRSRMWIQAEKAGWSEDRLAAIGKGGVNRSVVDHMATKVLSPPVGDQAAAVRRLLTAELGATTEVRSAVNDLTIALLATKVAGIGQSAARLAIASRGAAPGRKTELREAFNAFADKTTRLQIGKGDLRQLGKMNLLSPSKTGPIAAILGILK